MRRRGMPRAVWYTTRHTRGCHTCTTTKRPTSRIISIAASPVDAAASTTRLDAELSNTSVPLLVLGSWRSPSRGLHCCLSRVLGAVILARPDSWTQTDRSEDSLGAKHQNPTFLVPASKNVPLGRVTTLTTLTTLTNLTNLTQHEEFGAQGGHNDPHWHCTRSDRAKEAPLNTQRRSRATS